MHLGFGSFVSYVEQLFGYTPRSISEKLRVAEALEQLPASRAALEQGRLGWCALREVTRVAVKETEDAWLQAARGKTVRELEQLVAGKRPGHPPSATPDPRAVRYVLRWEVTAEAYALFREALLELRRRSSSCFDDDPVPKAAVTAPTISSRFARSVTARCTGASCAAPAMPATFGCCRACSAWRWTAARRIRRRHRARSMFLRGWLLDCASWVFARRRYMP